MKPFSIFLIGILCTFLLATPARSFLSSSLGTHNTLARTLPSRSSTPENSIQDAIAQKQIKEMVESNKVLLFMKGSKMFPQCGFSNAAVQIMQAVGTEFEVFDVFTDESIRQGIKTYSDWPTIPQLYIDGEFVGGSDIMIEMFQSGELQEILGVKS